MAWEAAALNPPSLRAVYLRRNFGSFSGPAWYLAGTANSWNADWEDAFKGGAAIHRSPARLS